MARENVVKQTNLVILSKHRPLRPIHGFSTGDIVRANVPKGKYKGTFTARVCPMSQVTVSLSSIKRGGQLIWIIARQFIERMDTDMANNYPNSKE